MPACSNLRGESGPSSPSRSAYAGLAFIHITYMKRCFNLKIQIFLKMYIIELPPPGTLKYLSDPTPPPLPLEENNSGFAHCIACILKDIEF